MLASINCPVCNNDAGYLFFDEGILDSVFFCSKCLEHFLGKEDASEMVNRIKKDSDKIDTKFIELYQKQSNFV